MHTHKLEPATLTKGELMNYLRIGDLKLNKLLTDPNFPKKKPILERWSKAEVDRWLNGDLVMQEPKQEDKGWKEYFND